MVEFGIMHPNFGRWLTVSGTGLLGLFATEPASLRECFPDDAEAGGQAFAMHLLDRMKADTLPDGLVMNIKPEAIHECAVFKFNPKVVIDPDKRNLDFIHHDCSAVCFDVMGPEKTVDRWVDFYRAKLQGERHNLSVITIDENSGLKTTRIWRRKSPVLQ